MCKINNKNTRTTSLTSFFTPFSSVSIVDFEEVNVSWDSISVSTEADAQKCFVKKVLLKNFANFTGKHLCQSFFYEVTDLRPAALLKKSLCRRCFPVNYANYLRTPFFIEHLWVVASVNPTLDHP